MRLEPGQHIGSYEVESELGAGGMAVVYRAKHRVLHSAHAIKVLDDKLARSEEVRQRFLSEARIQAGLRHPHITPVTDVIAEPGVAAIVMPLLSGEDLRVRLERTGAVPIQEAVTWTRQVLDALAFVHEQGVVHRDLKPANLFLETQHGGRKVVRVMDFGIARLADSKLTRTAMTMGTIHYMSPEQIQSPKTVDARSDLFSLGAVLYELVTGQVAFDGDTDFQIQMNIVHGTYARPGTIVPSQHAALSAAIDRALSTAPSDRFDCAQAFAHALQHDPVDERTALEDQEKPAAEAARENDKRPKQKRRRQAQVPAHHLKQQEDTAPRRASAAALSAPHQPPSAERRPPSQAHPPVDPQPGRITTHSLGTVSVERVIRAGFLGFGRQVQQEDVLVELPMVEVPPGTLSMEAKRIDADEHDDEGLRHTAEVGGLQIGQTPVTQGQYRAIMEMNPSYNTASVSHPVEKVSWFDAVRFCNALSRACGLEESYTIEDGKFPAVSCSFRGGGFRLPTEAEWEYAAKAGQDFQFSGSDDPDEVGWHLHNCSGTTHPVQLKKPNDWGLYDMSGNVWEWCWGSDDADHNANVVSREGAMVDTDPPVVEYLLEDQALKGGSSCFDSSRMLLAGTRLLFAPQGCMRFCGFRVVQTMPVPT